MINVKVLDNLQPEDVAMLQALYSRSPSSVEDHLEKVQKSGSSNFMDQFYIGYGHASIGDCGSTTIFIENISMLAAKAIQDNPLYSGQESSTRYIDFSKQLIIDPTRQHRFIQDRWMSFYHKASPGLLEHLKAKYPRQENEDEKVYERALKARSFDILRGFIPAGGTTNVSWHTNLRQAADKLAWLRHHPAQEMRDIASEIYWALKVKYPNSFKLDRDEISEWKSQVMNKSNYQDLQLIYRENEMRFVAVDYMDLHINSNAKELLSSRPKGAVLPHYMNEFGTINSNFLLDFGSFRDLQRHRNGVIRMPLLTQQYGMHSWYLEQLPEDLRREAEELIAVQNIAISDISDEVTRQYYIAMGFQVRVSMTQGLPAFVYRMDLRTSKTVHPTLRMVVKEEARQFQTRYEYVKLYADYSKDDWDIRRGTQTIEAK